MAQSTRDLLVGSMHECATVHATMNRVTNQHHATSEQHVECDNTRRAKDDEDFKVIITQLWQFNPFDSSDHRLLCLFTGAVANEKDGIN